MRTEPRFSSGAAAYPLLPCRESGSTLRFLIPAALRFGGGTFCGTSRLLDRGVGIYETLLRGSVDFQRSSDTQLRVSGQLHSGAFAVPGNVSSQFISGLLFALPMLPGDSVLTVVPPFESRGYVDLTLDAMRRFCIRVDRTGDSFFVPGGQAYQAADETVEGDWSQAAFFCAMNALGGEIRLDGLNAASLQGDRVCQTLLARIQLGYTEADLADCPDLGPVLMVLGLLCEGTTVIRNAERLRLKESDRIAAMEAELRACGGVLESEGGTITVHGCADKLHAPAGTLHGHNDHRVVMSLAVLALSTGLALTVDDAEAITKSWPNFFDAIKPLGAEVEYAG